MKNTALYHSLLLLAALIVVALIALVKSRNLHGFSGDYFLVSYAALVTLFQLSRIVSTLFYKHSARSVYADLPEEVRNSFYEPKVTFIVPCKNEEGAINHTIDMCFAADYPEEKLEVIVVNDGSTDNTADILDGLREKYPKRLRVVHWKKNHGKRAAMARGFTLSKGEILIQLDSDSFIQPENFRKLIEPFKNQAIGAVCAHADPENADQNFITKMQAAYYFVAFRILKAAESTYGVVFCCSGCCSAYRKSAVMPIMEKWLNEFFLGAPVTWGDDRSLTSWVIRGGYKTIYTDEAKSVTIVPSTFKQLVKQQIRWKKSWIVNAFFTGKFILRQEPFVALLYYYPLILISILTPFMAVRALFYLPVANGFESTLFYLYGIILITALIIIIYKYVARGNKYWPYMFAWSGLSTVFLTFLIFYAAATIQNRGWGTR